MIGADQAYACDWVVRKRKLTGKGPAGWHRRSRRRTAVPVVGSLLWQRRCRRYHRSTQLRSQAGDLRRKKRYGRDGGAKSVVVPHSVSSDLSQPALGNNHLSSLDLCCKQPRLHDLCCKQPRSSTPWQNCLSAHGLRFFYDSERSPGKMFCVDVNFSVLSQAWAGSAIIIKAWAGSAVIIKARSSVDDPTCV